jgi:hypothetical protein
MPSAFSLNDMRRFASEAWGPPGSAIVARWAEFNARYFGRRLRPVPLVLINTCCRWPPTCGGPRQTA